MKALKALWRGVEQGVLLAWRSYRYLALSVLVASAFAALVPYNTDEFIHYHTLLCHAYPLNTLNTFAGACGALDLNFLNTGLVLPLRAYLYSGSFPSLYYLPLFWLWPSPVSARLLNILFLLAQALVLGKLFRLGTWKTFLGLLLFFPYAFQHVVDTGPVSFQILCVYVCAWLFDRWTKKPSYLYPLLAAVLAFLAVWTKLIFIALLPGIGMLLALAVHQSRLKLDSPQAVSRVSAQLMAGALVFFGLTAALLLSTSPASPASHPLLEEILDKGEHYGPIELMQRLPHLEVTKTLLNPLAATHRIYDVWPIAHAGLTRFYALLLYAAVPLIALAALRSKELRRSAWKPLVVYILFPLTFLLIARTKASWAMHHTILSFPFLILSTLSLYSILRTARSAYGKKLRQIFMGCLGLFFAINILWFALFPAQAVQTSDDRSKERINALLHSEEIGGAYFYAVTDWGMYFYQGLYGPQNQSVIYPRGIYRQEEFAALKALSAAHERKMLFIVNSHERTTDLALIRTHFTLTRCEALDEEGAWQVWYEGELPACKK